MKKATVNDYFRHHWMKLMLFALFTAAVSFFAPLKNFQLKWLIDSKSKQEALGYMGLVFLITFTSWFFERLSRRSFTKLACGAVEQVRGQVMERVLRRPVSQYQREGDAAYLSLLTTDLRTLYDDYYMSLFNIAFWGGIMLCALGMYLYISPVMLAAILLVTVPPLVLPRKMNERLKASRDAFSLQMAGYTQQLKELLGGFEVIRGFLREDAYAARHRDAARQARDSEQAYQHDDGEDEVADERGVDHHCIEALLIAQLAGAGLPSRVPVASGVGVLPQKAPDDLKPAQKLLELLGVARHLEREGVAGSFEPLVHLAGQHQRRHGHE